MHPIGQYIAYRQVVKSQFVFNELFAQIQFAPEENIRSTVGPKFWRCRLGLFAKELRLGVEHSAYVSRGPRRAARHAYDSQHLHLR